MKLKLHKRKDLKVLSSEIWELTMTLCRPPYLQNTLLACGIQFGLTSSYYTLMVWFPELLTRSLFCNYTHTKWLFQFEKKTKTIFLNRFEVFEEQNPGNMTSVCIVSSFTPNSTVLGDHVCDSTIAPSVYLHVLYIGLACIPGSIILPIFIHKLGAKFFLSKSLVGRFSFK